MFTDHSSVRRIRYGWCVALDDTKDVYMTDDKFLRQVGKRKEPTRYIIDDMLDIDSVTRFTRFM